MALDGGYCGVVVGTLASHAADPGSRLGKFPGHGEIWLPRNSSNRGVGDTR